MTRKTVKEGPKKEFEKPAQKAKKFKAEQKILRDGEVRLRFITENMLEMVCELDLAGRYLYTSPSYQNILGYVNKELIGRSAFELIHPEDYGRAQESFKKSIQIKSLVREELRYRHAGGHYIWLEGFCKPVLDQKGRAIGSVVTSRDITGHKYAYEAQNREKHLFMAGPMVVFTWSREENGLVEYVSANVESEFGYQPDDFLSGRLLYYSLIHPEDREKSIEEGRVFHRSGVSNFEQEYRLLSANGQYKWVHDFTVVERDQDGKILHYHGYIIDITSRKQAEEALRKNTERLEKINACLLGLSHDHHQNINQLTALCGELLGAVCALYNRLDGELLCSIGQWQTPPGFKTADAPQGHICYDVIQGNKEDVLIVRDLPHTSYNDSDPNVRAYGLKTYIGHLVKSGGHARGSLCAVYQTDYEPSEDDLRILGILASAIGNEDSHRQAEEELLDSKLWFDTILQNVSAGVVVIDAENHKIADCNALAMRMIKAPKEQIVGAVCHRFICPAQQGKCPITDMGQTADNAERILLTGDGQSIPILKTVTRVTHQGRLYLMESFLDNTERMNAMLKLQESEAKHRTLFETMTQGVVYQDSAGEVLSANPAAERILGLTLAEMQNEASIDPQRKIIHEDGSEFLPAEHPSIRALHTNQEIRNVVMGILDLRRPTRTWINVNAIPQFKPGEQKPFQVYTIFEDITDRKRAEEERLRLEAQLQKAQKMEAIGTLAGGIAHDFNNILYAIIGNAEMALYDLPESSPARYPVEQVLKASFRARDLVRQILAFSRQAEKEIKPVNVNMIVKEAMKLLRATLPTTIEIRVKITALRNTVLGDPTQIHQVLMNLCTNAHHAMLEMGGILEVNLSDLELDAETAAQYPGLKPGGYLRLAVMDTGHGMNREIMERIFDPYFTTKEKGVGTGLGLAVVHGIVKGLGGAINVQSEPGKGSTFEVFLPLVNLESLPDSLSPDPVPRGYERILFVDDEEDIAGLARRMLENIGYQAVIKTSSRQALETFKADPGYFDLIITDMTMPQMTGDQLAIEIMALRPQMPVILCTGFSERISEEKTKALGIKAFVMKPLVMREIAKIIRKVLDENK